MKSVFLNRINADAVHELHYMKTCIEFIGEKVGIEVDEMNTNFYDFTLSLEEMSPEEADHYDWLSESRHNELNHYESLSTTIINSLIIRQIAVVEKFFVKDVDACLR